MVLLFKCVNSKDANIYVKLKSVLFNFYTKLVKCFVCLYFTAVDVLPSGAFGYSVRHQNNQSKSN